MTLLNDLKEEHPDFKIKFILSLKLTDKELKNRSFKYPFDNFNLCYTNGNTLSLNNYFQNEELIYDFNQIKDLLDLNKVKVIINNNFVICHSESYKPINNSLICDLYLSGIVYSDKMILIEVVP